MVHNHKIQVTLHYVGHSVRQNGCTIDTGLKRFSYHYILFIIKGIEFKRQDQLIDMVRLGELKLTFQHIGENIIIEGRRVCKIF